MHRRKVSRIIRARKFLLPHNMRYEISLTKNLIANLSKVSNFTII